MRYIDADILIKNGWRLERHAPSGMVISEMSIADVPTADVVEVVRCSECKHLEIINKAPIYAKCKKHGIVFELWQEDTREHFCSFGARMDGDADDV